MRQGVHLIKIYRYLVYVHDILYARCTVAYLINIFTYISMYDAGCTRTSDPTSVKCVPTGAKAVPSSQFILGLIQVKNPRIGTKHRDTKEYAC